MDRDFSMLPELVWVEIMKFLPLSERAHLALTCHALNNAFCHPALWQTVEMKMLGDLKVYNFRNQAIILPNQYKELAARFGYCFQHLTLKLTGFVKKCPEDCKQILSELSRDCRLESLVLDVGTMVSREHFSSYTYQPEYEDLRVFAQLIENAVRLKSFALIAWPRFFRRKTFDILDTLRANKKLRDLEKLNLYGYYDKQGSWNTINAVVPTPDEVLDLIKTFPKVTSLSMRSTMIDDNVVNHLANPPQTALKHLGILVTYTTREKQTRTQVVHANAWKKLCTYSPDLLADFTIMNRVPYIELAGILNLHIPMRAVKFLRYSRCGAMDIVSITDKFNTTLTTFVDYTDGTDCDAELVAMVTRCTKMDTLVYNGTLHAETVLTLAKLRGSKWKNLRFNTDNIKTEPIVDEDEDAVITVSADGNISTPLTRNYESEEDRAERLNELLNQFTQIIGYKMLKLSVD